MSKTNRSATCWRISLSNNQLLCFTDSDQDIIYKNERYISGSYFTPSCIVSSNELGQDNFKISGIIDGDYISKEALLRGDLATSYIEVFLINLDDLPAERQVLKTGWLGEIKFNHQSFVAEVCSISSKCDNIIGKYYSSSCRAEFADQYCGINLAEYSFKGEVTSLAEKNSFIDKQREEPDGYFAQGILVFTSGVNSGYKYHVQEFSNQRVSLDFVTELKITIGDRYNIIAGCDKMFNTCVNKFSNSLCFRGEPFIPSKHKLVVGN